MAPQAHGPVHSTGRGKHPSTAKCRSCLCYSYDQAVPALPRLSPASPGLPRSLLVPYSTALPVSLFVPQICASRGTVNSTNMPTTDGHVDRALVYSISDTQPDNIRFWPPSNSGTAPHDMSLARVNESTKTTTLKTREGLACG